MFNAKDWPQRTPALESMSSMDRMGGGNVEKSESIFQCGDGNAKLGRAELASSSLNGKYFPAN